MSKPDRYNVCVARKYTDRGSGAEKTHFWNVGKAFASEKPDGKKMIKVTLYSRTLMVDELLLFEDTGEGRLADSIRNRPNQQAADTPDDDDIPF